MTQSMDPSLLGGFTEYSASQHSSVLCSNEDAPHQQGRPAPAMTRSLGPEQLQEALSGPRTTSGR